MQTYAQMQIQKSIQGVQIMQGIFIQANQSNTPDWFKRRKPVGHAKRTACPLGKVHVPLTAELRFPDGHRGFSTDSEVCTLQEPSAHSSPLGHLTQETAALLDSGSAR